jgi:hypothetical protein
LGEGEEGVFKNEAIEVHTHTHTPYLGVESPLNNILINNEYNIDSKIIRQPGITIKEEIRK